MTTRTIRKKTRIMLVCMNGDGPHGGFPVRVILIMKTLLARGFAVTLLRLYPALRSKGSWRKELALLEIDLIEIPLPPISRYPFLRSLAYALANPLIHIIAKLRRAKLIQAEAHEAGRAVLLCRWTAIPAVIDFHGAAPEESLHRFEKGLSQNRWEWLDDAEALCLRRADAAFVVSEKMTKHLKNKHIGLKFSTPYIVPVNVEQSFIPQHDKAVARNLLGFHKEDRVLVYSGSAQEYQCLKEMADIFRKLREKDSHARLLILSKDQQEFEKIFRQSAPEYTSEIVFRSVSKHEVPNFLVAADAAFLLRHNEILNIVSCPTKLGEYLFCGLPIITTEWAGHAPDLVRQYGIGVVVDPNSDETIQKITELLAKINADMTARCINVAKRHLMWETSEEIIMECYQKLNVNAASTINSSTLPAS